MSKKKPDVPKQNHLGIGQKSATPSAEELELNRINSALRESGQEYPLGYRGVRDLISLADSKHALCEQFSKDIRRSNELRKEAEDKAVKFAKERDKLYEANVELMTELGRGKPVPADGECDHRYGFIGKPSMCGSCGTPKPIQIGRLTVLDPNVFSIPTHKLQEMEVGGSITSEVLGVGSITVTKVGPWGDQPLADWERELVEAARNTELVEEETMEDEGAFGYNAYARSINSIEEEMSGLRGRLEFLHNEVKNYSSMSHLPHYFANDGDGGPLRCVRCGEHEEGLLSENATCPGYDSEEPDGRPDEADCKPAPKRVQLVVMHNDNTATFHDSKGGWKIDSTNRTLLIGKGLGRVLVPLDNVRYFSPEAY